jgi:hypothetical protein
MGLEKKRERGSQGREYFWKATEDGNYEPKEWLDLLGFGSKNNVSMATWLVHVQCRLQLDTIPPFLVYSRYSLFPRKYKCRSSGPSAHTLARNMVSATLHISTTH